MNIKKKTYPSCFVCKYQHQTTLNLGPHCKNCIAFSNLELLPEKFFEDQKLFVRQLKKEGWN